MNCHQSNDGFKYSHCSFTVLHRGLAPQNKPELQKVLEKRKREQILKAQKEEQEAHMKRSDLEIELMKRQQKLEQVNVVTLNTLQMNLLYIST